MNIAIISEVNGKYIFFKNENGTPNCKPSHYAELSEIMDDLQTDYYFYNRMLKEVETSYNRINAEYERVEKRIEDLKKQIEERKEEPIIRRGLADVCFSHKSAEMESMRLGMQLSGIRTVSQDTRNKLERTERLIRQVKSAMRVCVG